MVKQVIILRKDLKMRLGKAAAQAAHASMAVFFDRIHSISNTKMEIGSLNADMREWAEGTFTKIVVGADNLQDLIEAYRQAKQKGIPTALIIDAGKTEFHGESTPTAVAIGPAQDSKIDEITGKFKLL